MSSAELKERFSIELEPSIEDFVAQLEAEMKHIEVNIIGFSLAKKKVFPPFFFWCGF